MKLIEHLGTSITVEIGRERINLTRLVRHYYKPNGPLLRTEVQRWAGDELQTARLERTTLPRLFTPLSPWRVVEK